ncbi:MAG TPA: tagaturonate epimerase family protein, partial [Ktedonobacterales bacterium]
MAVAFPFSQAELLGQLGAHRYADSLVIQDGLALWYDVADAHGQIVVVGDPAHLQLARFHGERHALREGYVLQRGPANAANARALRATLPWLQPRPLGLSTSAGLGDRLGLATPGHIRALRHVLRDRPGGHMRPIFAQQSIREMGRTGRQPEAVLNDATWGAFQAGWRDSVGADADHLKTVADIDACAAAGFTFYTFDPGDYVDLAAEQDAPALVAAKVAALPWEALESSPQDLARRYVRRAL